MCHYSDSTEAKHSSGAAKRERPPGIKKQLLAGSQSPAPWVPSSRHISVLAAFDLPLSSNVKQRKSQDIGVAAPHRSNRSSSSREQPVVAAEEVSDRKAAASASEEEPCRQAGQQTQQQEQASENRQFQQPAGNSPTEGGQLSGSAAWPADALLAAQAELGSKPSTMGLSSQPSQTGVSIHRISSEAPVLLRAPSCRQQTDE